MLDKIRLSLVFLTVISLCCVLLTGRWLPVTKSAAAAQRRRLTVHVLEAEDTDNMPWLDMERDMENFTEQSGDRMTSERSSQLNSQKTEARVDWKQLQNLLESRCNTIAPQLLPSDEGQLHKNGYEVAVVQVLTRHGDRAPLKGIPLANIASFRCPTGDEYFSDIDVRMMHKCHRGKLTWKGCRQHEALGRHLKTVYRLDPDEIDSHMMVASTDYQRTTQSAKCLLNGLLGHNQYRQVVKSIGTLFYNKKFGYADNCPSQGNLWKQIQLQPEFQRAQSTWLEARSKMQNFLSHSRKKIKPHQGAIEFYEGLVCHYCHLYDSGLSNSITPCGKNDCISPSLGKQTIEAADMFTRLQNNKKSALLQIQPFIAQIVSNFRKWIDGDKRHQFFFYSGHDTTVTAVLSALNAFDGHRPAYASRIVFELWQSLTTKEYMVRTLYNGHVISSNVISEFMSFRLFESNLMKGSLRSRESHTRGCFQLFDN